MAASKKWGGYPPSPKCAQVRRKPDSLTKRAKRKLRKAEKLQKRRANATVTGANRPLCKLDAQAKELGVYNHAYHCMTRVERKSIVSTTLTEQLSAA
jgi:hypothetical protein